MQADDFRLRRRKSLFSQSRVAKLEQAYPSSAQTFSWFKPRARGIKEKTSQRLLNILPLLQPNGLELPAQGRQARVPARCGGHCFYSMTSDMAGGCTFPRGGSRVGTSEWFRPPLYFSSFLERRPAGNGTCADVGDLPLPFVPHYHICEAAEEERAYPASLLVPSPR